jgi:hypothetical protein
LRKEGRGRRGFGGRRARALGAALELCNGLAHYERKEGNVWRVEGKREKGEGGGGGGGSKGEEH